MPLPALRYVDMVPILKDGERYFCLADPTRLVQEQLLLSPTGCLMATLLDGRNDMADIQAVLRAQLDGAAPDAEDIAGFVGQLDAAGFLLTERYRALKRTAHEAYLATAERRAAFAGLSYPAEADALRAFLDAQFVCADGPGALPGSRPGTGAPLPGIVSPHIDFHRGGPAYAHAYGKLYSHGKPDTVIVFGVAHMAEAAPFILTRKPFATPLGTLHVDETLMDELERASDWDPYEYELVHQYEHSIEFQAVMLAYLYGPDVRIVPVLASSFAGEDGEFDGQTRARVDRFLEVCARHVRDGERHVTVVAGADLAHVGRRFGDDYEIDAAIMEQVAARDRADLAHLERPNALAFHRAVMIDDNARRVCGVNCIYAALKSLDGAIQKGEQLYYGAAPDPSGGIVSFASYALR